jgi:hypothetical protein
MIGFAVTTLIVWVLILRRGAYPASITMKIKLSHALLLLIISFEARLAWDSLWWFIVNSHELSSVAAFRSTKLGSPIAGLVELVFALLAVPLFIVCLHMAVRNRRSLKPFLVIWTVMFSASVYRFIADPNGERQAHVVVITILLWSAFFIVSVIFYSRKRVLGEIFVDRRQSDNRAVPEKRE